VAGGGVVNADDVDEVAVERACKGDHTVTLNRAETAAAVALCERRGLSARQTAELLGITDRTVVRVRSGETHPHARAGVTVDHTKEKIAAALRSESPHVQRAAKRANDALAALDTVLHEWDAKEAARERVAELEKALAEAKAALRGKPSKATAAPGEHKQARAWARAQGIDVPPIGRVPSNVLDAWRRAAA
jgi:predicted transcriptional regulator